MRENATSYIIVFIHYVLFSYLVVKEVTIHRYNHKTTLPTQQI